MGRGGASSVRVLARAMAGRIPDRAKLGRQYLSSSEETAPRRQERDSGYMQVFNKAGRLSEHQKFLLSKENEISSEGI